MANGKLKGGGYEREISKKLSLWISENNSEDLFWRTQGSGGRHTIRRKKNRTLDGQAGDISSMSIGVSEEFLKYFCVEIKFYKDINIWGIVTKSKSGLLEFWDQAYDQALSVNKIPILIVKQNYKPPLLISSEPFNRYMELLGLKSELEVNLFHKKIFIWKLEDILGIDPNRFMSVIKQEK